MQWWISVSFLEGYFEFNWFGTFESALQYKQDLKKMFLNSELGSVMEEW